MHFRTSRPSVHLHTITARFSNQQENCTTKKETRKKFHLTVTSSQNNCASTHAIYLENLLLQVPVDETCDQDRRMNMARGQGSGIC